MSELPPDLPRLHAIADWLRHRLAEHETIGTYLRLQAEKVGSAIERAATDPGDRPGTGVSAGTGTDAEEPRFRLQPMRVPEGRATLHLDDCWITDGHPVSHDEALLALHEPIIELCPACRPREALRETPTPAPTPMAAPTPTRRGTAG
ncbi:DUF6233 domain-containing protein [Streptomyces sp. NPDC054796]